jgi:hypothetical protein
MNRVLIDSYWFIIFLYSLLSNKKGIDTYSQITLSKRPNSYLLSTGSSKDPGLPYIGGNGCCKKGYNKKAVVNSLKNNF